MNHSWCRAVHFITMRTLHSPYLVQERPHVCSICLCDNDIVYARFEDARISLYVFMSDASVFVLKEFFFPTEYFDYFGRDTLREFFFLRENPF